MKTYRQVLLGMILAIAAWNTGLLLYQNIGALSNQGIWWVSFNIYNEMYWEIGVWILELLMIPIFLISGIKNRRDLSS